MKSISKKTTVQNMQILAQKCRTHTVETISTNTLNSLHNLVPVKGQ